MSAARGTGGAHQPDRSTAPLTPGLSGHDVFREIRRLNASAKIVLSSGNSEQTTTRLLTGPGLAGFLPKPYRFEELIEKVRGLLQQ